MCIWNVRKSSTIEPCVKECSASLVHSTKEISSMTCMDESWHHKSLVQRGVFSDGGGGVKMF